MTTNAGWTVTHEIVYVRPDGSRGAVMSSDAYRAPTLAYYQDNGYRIDYVSTTEGCNACDGRGWRASKRNRLARVSCAACKGVGVRVTAPQVGA